jgi:hypothetical protein
MREIERREPDFARETCSRAAPMQAARNHQMHEEEQMALKAQDEPLAKPTHLHDEPSLRIGQRRIGAPQDKGIGQPHSLDTSANHLARKRLDVEGQIG